MDSITQRKVRKALLIGTSYFILLACTYVAFEIYYNSFSLSDLAFIAFACLPILIQKRVVSFIFGCITAIIEMYLGFAFVIAHERSAHSPAIIPVETWMFVIGYAVIFLSFCASLLLVYSATSISEKRFSLL